MRKFRNMLALLLAMVLVLGLAACGTSSGETATNDDSTPQAADSSQSQSADTTVVTADSAEKADIEAALDLVLTAVILGAGADITHRQIQYMRCDRGMGDAGCGCSHNHLCFGVFMPDRLSDGIFHVDTDVRRGEDEPVVAVDRAFNAAGPGERLVGPEKNCFNG